MKQKKQELLLLPVLLCMLLFSANNMMAQTIKGNVKDDVGEPMIGVNIFVEGTSTGAVTDLDGNFTIKAKPGDVLKLTYIGYISVETKAKNNMVIIMKEDAQQLNELVVIGYGSVRKADATGSIATLEADPKMKGVAPTADDMLVGKIAGVTVTTGGGSATSGSTIRIRGGSSLSASNDPLIILDGVYLDNSGIGGVGNMLSTIDPNDIESFTVLKDASATAIYGSRASNGVILITTKKGERGKIKLTYDGNISVASIKKKVDVMTGDEYRAFIKEAFAGASNEDEVLSKLGTANTDWQDQIYHTAISTEHNLSAYGSIGKFMPFRASLGYTRNSGILKTDNMNRWTGSLNLNPSFMDDHLKVNILGKIMNIKSRFPGGAIGAAVFMDPTQPVYDPASKFDGFWSWTGTDGSLINVATKNPVSLLEDWHDTANVWNFIGSAQAEYSFFYVPGLKLKFNYSIDTSHSIGNSNAPYNAPAYAINLGYNNDWTNTRTNQQMDVYLNYIKDIKSIKSHFDIMAGYSWQHYHLKNDWYTIGQFEYDDDGELQPDETSVSTGYSETEHYIVSFFGRLNYGLADKYLFTFTLRDDGSSRFSKANRWGLFPSLALAWRMIEEDWFKNQDIISNLKLRLGWGKTGQQDINQGDYPYLGSYTYSINNSASYWRNGEWIRLLKPNAYNEDLKWETTTTWNIGLDFGLLRNRINGAIDWYYRKTTNLINAEAKVPAGANFAEYVVANIGSLSNTGLEITLNTIPIQTKEFTWELDANVAFNKNQILQLTNGNNATEIRRYGRTGSGDGSFQLQAHAVGHEAGMYYVYEQVYDEDGKPIEGAFVDQNGDGQLNEDDLRLYHSPNPDMTFGINTKLQYKNWDMSMAGHGSLGNYNYNAVASNSAGLSQGSIYANAFLSNRTMSAFETGWQTTKVLSDYYVQNASFFRIDNITIGYSFSKFFGIQHLGGRVYATVQNPFIFTKYKGLDPEIADGFDDSFYPRPITYMFGLTFNF